MLEDVVAFCLCLDLQELSSLRVHILWNSVTIQVLTFIGAKPMCSCDFEIPVCLSLTVNQVKIYHMFEIPTAARYVVVVQHKACVT